jgi:hypothetical protein
VTGEKKEGLVLDTYYLSKLVTSNLNMKTDEVTRPPAHKIAVNALSVGQLYIRINRDISPFAVLINFDTKES